LAENRSGGVATDALEAFSVAAVDEDFGVDVYAADLGEGLGGRGHEADGAHELVGALSRGGAEELEVGGGGAVAGGEHGLVVDDVVGALVDAFEAAAVALEHAHERLVGPRRHLRDLLAGGLGQSVELELALLIADVDAVEGQGMSVLMARMASHARGTFNRRALSARWTKVTAYSRVADGAQAESALGAPLQRAGERADERAQDVGAELAVVAEYGAQVPRKGAHPLADRDLGQDLVDEVGGDVGHAAPEAGGAEAATSTGERDHELVAAARARELHEAVLEEATAQVLVELTHDEGGEAALFLGALEEARPVLADELVQQRLLGATALVAVGS